MFCISASSAIEREIPNDSLIDEALFVVATIQHRLNNLTQHLAHKLSVCLSANGL